MVFRDRGDIRDLGDGPHAFEFRHDILKVSTAVFGQTNEFLNDMNTMNIGDTQHVFSNNLRWARKQQPVIGTDKNIITVIFVPPIVLEPVENFGLDSFLFSNGNILCCLMLHIGDIFQGKFHLFLDLPALLRKG